MKVLIVIDMQNDFITGSLGTKEAQNIVPLVAQKIRKYKKARFPVIFSRDTHHENYLETQEGRLLPVIHCLEGSSGWEISKEIDTEGSKIFDKPTFGSLSLCDYVSHLEGIDEAEIVGVCTGICVLSNSIILKAKAPEIKITVDSSCTACVNPETHETALKAMRLCQINVI